MKKQIGLLAFFFLPAFLLKAQDISYQTVQGTVVHAATGEAVPMATVSLPSMGLATMTNTSGRFSLSIPANGKADSISVSHIGFETIKLPLRTDGSLLTVRLIPYTNLMSEVLIINESAVELIKKAIAKIPQNYAAQPFLSQGFYRLTARKSQRYIHISEAAFDIHSRSYERKTKSFRLKKARAEKDVAVYNGVDNIVLGLKPSGVFEFDIVSDIEESDLLSRQGLKEHQFTLNGIRRIDGSDAYEIGFDQKDGLKKALYKGVIYLDVKRLAFVSLRFWMSPKGLPYLRVKNAGQRALMSLLDIHVKPMQDTTSISYRLFGPKYYLSHVGNAAVMNVHSGRHRFNFIANTRIDYLTTGIDTVNTSGFRDDELMNDNKFIEFQASGEDKEFWKGYNLIPADYDPDAVAQSIQQQNKELNNKSVIEQSLRKFRGSETEQIDSILSFYHGKGLFNGTALIAYKGEVIYKKGFGYSDVSKQIPNTGGTVFRIGSVSKQFTALLILKLAAENKLSLKDTIGRFLPAYAHPGLTIEQLLTHQSGLPNYTDNADYLAQVLQKSFSLEELVKKFCSDPLQFKPGSRFSYSNSGYVVLALLVEKLSGKSYAVFLSENILLPAGMQHSFAGEAPAADSLARGYENGREEPGYPVVNTLGAGGISATAEDLFRWERALSAGKLLPSPAVDELFRPRAFYADWNADYGYGWMTDRLLFSVSRDHTVHYHPGTDIGFYSMLARQPDKGIVVVLLSNHGDFPRFDITDLVLKVIN
ncbi:MAG TPA: serine hydrolase [Flavisolibacter sp.]|nr:serine hydrolase [Flavisolibacter sp.]